MQVWANVKPKHLRVVPSIATTQLKELMLIFELNYS